MVQISFYDTLEGVDDGIRIRLNEKIEEIRQQAQQKLATMVIENEKKEE